MVQLFSQDKKDPKKFRGFSYPTYLDIREQNTVFSDAMSFNLALIGLGQKGDTRRAFAAIVSSNYFSVLGVPLARGRAFLPEEETPGRNTLVVIVSYSYWQKHDLDPAIAARDGGGSATGGMPQPRKHAARARHSTAQGDRDPSRARRQPLADRAPAPHRRFCTRTPRRCGWTYSWTVVVRSAGWLNAQADAARHSLVERSEPRNFGGDVRILPARHAHVCARAGL